MSRPDIITALAKVRRELDELRCDVSRERLAAENTSRGTGAMIAREAARIEGLIEGAWHALNRADTRARANDDVFGRPQP